VTHDHDRYTEDLAPYVLGALPPVEAKSLEEHLRSCDECEQEIEHLRMGVAVLGRSVETVEPPPSLREKLMRKVEEDSGREGARTAVSSTRTRHWTKLWTGWKTTSRAFGPATAAAASVFLVLGGLAGWLLHDAQRPAPRTVAAVVDRERLPEARGRLAVSEDGEVVLRLAGLPDLGARRNYEVFIRRDGEVTRGPVFGPSESGACVIGVPGRLEGVEAVLVTRERAGGTRSPTEKPVVEIPISS
jgi:anti-sigma factor RsiW